MIILSSFYLFKVNTKVAINKEMTKFYGSISVILLISVFFLTFGVFYLTNGCYHNIGNCQNFFSVDVIISNIEHYTDDTIINVHQVNCEITGSYIYSHKNYNCSIIDDRNVGACGDFIHGEYPVSSVRKMYSKYDNHDECYTKSNITSSAKLGLIFVIVGTILFLVPTCLLIIIKVMEYKNNILREQISDTVEIQLSSAFRLDDHNDHSSYMMLPTNDTSIHGLLRTGSNNSSNGTYIEL